MNLLGRKKDNARTSVSDVAEDTAETGVEGDARASGESRTTAPKGRPTPKRSEASRKRGPVAPAPLTTAEARKRRREMRTKLTREERKAEKSARRAIMAERREKMMAGNDGYLLPRDKGPVRRYARDLVDSRRNVLSLFMPAAMVLILVMLSAPSVAVQQFISPAMLVLVVIMTIDGFIIGRKVNRLVDSKFPGNVESGWKLGLYAASRASQLRRMRAPRPQVERGTSVS